MLSSLQLSEGTVVILDETGLEPGKVSRDTQLVQEPLSLFRCPPSTAYLEVFR